MRLFFLVSFLLNSPGEMESGKTNLSLFSSSSSVLYLPPPGIIHATAK